MTRDCDGGWAGYFFGHRMRPRYSRKERWSVLHGKDYWKPNLPAEAFLPDIEEDIYEGDVCERCGYTVKPGSES
jgi:hypothetical protein